MELEKLIQRYEVQSEYKEFINEFVEMVKNEFREKVHSIYICGSIAKGTAKPNKSDADFTIIVSDKIIKSYYSKINDIRSELLNKYKCIPRIDITLCTVKDILESCDWGFWIKIISYCIYGNDLGEQVQPVIPTVNLVLELNKDTLSIIDSNIDKLDNAADSSTVSLLRNRLVKRSMRALFSLVLMEHVKWEDKIFDMKEIVKEYMPEESELVESLYGFYELDIENQIEFSFTIHKIKTLIEKKLGELLETLKKS